MRRFHVCIHDASPAWTSETRTMVRDLSPLLGRRFSCGVVPDWHGRWPLARYPEYCRLVQEGCEERLLHGYLHRRRRGWGAAAFIAENSDEMNGMDQAETRRTLERGQRVFAEVFGAPASVFLPPAWQRGHVRFEQAQPFGLEHVLGYFSLVSHTGRSVPLTTWTWDCGRWAWLGHIGWGLGWLRHSPRRRVPVLAVHPRDLERGFWPGILRLVEEFLESGYEPSTLAGLLEANDVRADA